MENQDSYNSRNVSGQAQMRREWSEMQTPASSIHSQGQATNFLEETGSQVKNMAYGAAEVGKGAAQGAINLARKKAFIGSEPIHKLSTAWLDIVFFKGPSSDQKAMNIVLFDDMI
ncbi:Unknown protein [Striga hermonthica]|uniref:Uncharacterized protein n=1 Tax=Striga hermonthica TaxID=68872 RepID=A0A9N7MY09_STRHE|nr:Unknown protein [Striga hermonthica]